MGKHRRERREKAFELALQLAESGRYRNVGEVEEALRSKEPELTIPDIKWIRGHIDVTCLHARKQRGWDA